MGEAVWRTVDISRRRPGDRGHDLPARAAQRRGLGHGRRPARRLRRLRGRRQRRRWPSSPGRAGRFCAGADLKALAEGDRRPVVEDGPGPMGPTRLELSKPVIAAIEGHAVAGGLELALWCDLRVAATDAVLGVYCRRFGVPLVDGGTVRLPRLVGPEPRPRPRAHRARRGGPRGAGHGAREPPGPARAGPARRPWRWPPSWPRFPRPACATTAAPSCGSGGWPSPTPWCSRPASASTPSPAARRRRGAARFAAGAGRHGAPVADAGAGRADDVTTRSHVGAWTERMPGHDVVAAFDFDGTLTRGGSVWRFLTAMCGRDAVLSAGISLFPKLVRAALFGGRSADDGQGGALRAHAGRPARRAMWPSGPWPSGSRTTVGVTAPRSGPGSTGTGARGIASSWCRRHPSTTCAPRWPSSVCDARGGHPSGGRPRAAS